MAETEKTEQVNEIVETPVTTETKEVKPEEKKEEVELDSSGNPIDQGPGFVRRTMEKLGIIKPETQSENIVVNDKPDDIPDEFTNAAKAAGWADADIVDVASGMSDDELKEMIPFLSDESELEPPVKPVAKQEENPKSQPKVDLSKEEFVKTLKEEIRKEFQDELNALKEKQKVVDEVTETQRSQAMLHIVNSAFDEAGKQFEVFGQTKDLPVFPAGPKKGQYVPTSPQIKARNEVWSKAYAFIQAGIPVNEAMSDALTWYKGKNLESDVKKGLIRDLKKNESKLSAKRTSKETVPTFEDEDERRADFIKKEAERLGIKLVQE